MNPPLSPPPLDAAGLCDVDDLHAARGFVREEALRAGVSDDRATDLLVAANEAITNAFVHGRGPTDVWACASDHRFICQIEDRGARPVDPLAGYLPPTDEL